VLSAHASGAERRAGQQLLGVARAADSEP
jgi:hypothetical protein